MQKLDAFVRSRRKTDFRQGKWLKDRTGFRLTGLRLNHGGRISQTCEAESKRIKTELFLAILGRLQI